MTSVEKTDKQSILTSGIGESLAAFLIPLFIYGGLAIWSLIDLNLVSVQAAEQSELARGIALGQSPVMSDSRFFLYPLPVLIQSIISLIPPLSQGVFAQVAFTVVSASLSSVLFTFSLKNTGLPLVIRWLLLIGWLTNPVVILEAVNGSGMMALMLIYMALFASLSKWLHRYTWRPLAFLGFAGSLAALTHLNTLMILVLPIIGVVLSAFYREPRDLNFAEHSFWLITTPVAYAVLIRIFFSELIFDDPFFFLSLDKLFPQPLPIVLPALNGADIIGLFLHILDWVWIVAPLLIPLTAIYMITAAVHVRPGAVIFIGMAWFPLAFSLLSEKLQPLNRPNSYLLLLVPAAIFIAAVFLRTIRSGRRLTALFLVLLLIAANLLTLLNFLSLPDESEYKTFLDRWISVISLNETGGEQETEQDIADLPFSKARIHSFQLSAEFSEPKL